MHERQGLRRGQVVITVSLRCLGVSAFHQPDPPVLELPDRATVEDAIARLGLPGGLETVRLVNGSPAVPDAVLSQGDVLTLVPIVEGG